MIFCHLIFWTSSFGHLLSFFFFCASSCLLSCHVSCSRRAGRRVLLASWRRRTPDLGRLRACRVSCAGAGRRDARAYPSCRACPLATSSAIPALYSRRRFFFFFLSFVIFCHKRRAARVRATASFRRRAGARHLVAYDAFAVDGRGLFGHGALPSSGAERARARRAFPVRHLFLIFSSCPSVSSP